MTDSPSLAMVPTILTISWTAGKVVPAGNDDASTLIPRTRKEAVEIVTLETAPSNATAVPGISTGILELRRATSAANVVAGKLGAVAEKTETTWPVLNALEQPTSSGATMAFFNRK